ncbi:hypothetical protein K438DRAFT_1762225 [Mycena galopus ATCC 62051]|nr:hypothetical protein K438DRAFT_1762225 [Mycena galopus ATCC 62051]
MTCLKRLRILKVLSRPQEAQSHRNVILDGDEDVWWTKPEGGAVLAELSDKKIKGFKLHVTHNVKPFMNRMQYTPEVSSRPDHMEKDMANAKALVAKLESEAAELRKIKIR